MMPDLWAILPEALSGLSGLSGLAGQPEFSRAVFSTSTSSDVACSLVNGVAVIEVHGTLSQYSTWYSTSYAAIRAAMDSALDDPAASAILLAFNSPGGAVAGCKELADFIVEARQKKPCAAYADGLCASAAYWLASATGRVFAPVTAQVGSIGVMLVHADFSKMNERMGIAYSTITGGEWKAAGNENEPLSDEVRAMLQQRVNGLHTLFRADVARSMNIDTAASHTWAEGQVFLAGESQGLITDIVSDLSEAVNLFAQENHMDKDTFAAKHPDLLAAIEKEIREKVIAETGSAGKPDTPSVDASVQTVAPTSNETLALVGAVLGEEARTRLEGVFKAGITATQFAALAPFFNTNTAQPASVQRQPETMSSVMSEAEAASRTAILAGLQAAHTGPLSAFPGTVPNQTATSALLADAERRSQR